MKISLLEAQRIERDLQEAAARAAKDAADARTVTLSAFDADPLATIAKRRVEFETALGFALALNNLRYKLRDSIACANVKSSAGTLLATINREAAAQGIIGQRNMTRRSVLGLTSASEFHTEQGMAAVLAKFKAVRESTGGTNLQRDDSEMVPVLNEERSRALETLVARYKRAAQDARNKLAVINAQTMVDFDPDAEQLGAMSRYNVLV